MFISSTTRAKDRFTTLRKRNASLGDKGGLAIRTLANLDCLDVRLNIVPLPWRLAILLVRFARLRL